MTPRPSRRPESFTLNRASPLYQGLVFAHLGQHPGSTFYKDESPFGNHGKLTGFTGAGNTPDVQWGWDGTLRRWCLNFNGTTDYVDVPKPAVTSGQFTLAAWVYCPDPAAAHRFFALADDGPQLRLQGTSASVVHQTTFDLNNFFAGPAGAWTHLAAVRSGGVLSGYAGGLFKLANSSFSYTYSLNTGAALGKAPGSISEWYVGKVADPLIYNGPLPAGALAALADPDNVDLRPSRSGQPLILPVRRYWPVAPASGAGALLRRLVALGTD